VHGLCRVTIGLKIILDTPDRTQGDVGQVESYLGPFRDIVNIGVR
jgi:hypothetical protein